MPKARSTRPAVHERSARLSKRAFVSNGLPELIEVGRDAEVPATKILSTLEPEDKPALKKKEKRKMKHEAFIERLEQGRAPYSKSHAKRLKRKAKEQIASGLDDVAHALPDIHAYLGMSLADANASIASGSDVKLEPKAKAKRKQQVGLIGEGKGAPLSKNQRKQVLKTEKVRQSLLLATSEFTSNPFQLLRKHLQNTLVKHEPVKKRELDS